MSRCYVGMGGNLGGSPQVFTSVIDDLHATSTIFIHRVSSFYRTQPLDNANQPAYLNAVLELDTDLSADQLLDVLQALEKKYGRVRTAARWDSRTLDLDILLFAQQVINDARLTVPHRAMAQRDFVLYPLYEIASDLQVPGLGSLAILLSQCENRGMEKL